MKAKVMVRVEHAALKGLVTGLAKQSHHEVEGEWADVRGPCTRVRVDGREVALKPKIVALLPFSRPGENHSGWTRSKKGKGKGKTSA